MAKIRTGFGVAALSGSMEGGFIAVSRSGSVFRKKPQYARVPSPGQQAAAERLAIVTRLWCELGLAEIDAWNEYAAGLEKVDRITGARYHSTGIAAFTALSTKILQIDAEAEIPRTPPSAPFELPRVRLSAQAAPGGVVFQASGSFPEGVLAELMVQELPNIRRTPRRQYRSAAFTPFSSGLDVSLPLEPGAYALAYRFVEATTGRVGTQMLLGKVTIGE